MPGSLRVLVTGAGGFVGSWLLSQLSSSLPIDAEVMASRRGVLGKTASSVDITKIAEVDTLIGEFRPTCVVHLAAISSLDQARLGPREAWNVNLFGAMNVAEAVMRHVPETRFIFAGSSEIYGGTFNRVSGGVDEYALPDPRNVYAATKAAADLMLGQMAETGLRAVRFRVFNHTGPGQSTQFVVPAFASQIAAIERGECEPVIKVGNLDARRDFLDVRDVVQAYVLAVTARDLPNGVIFNLASGKSRRIGDILNKLLTMSSAEIEVEQDQRLLRPSDVPITVGDAHRANTILNWRPAISWETTLRDILDAYRSRPSG